uniref:Uncharacterized protein n=3 Tax=Arion vulgaris TaxID=1028688 RepID=A0A0B7BRE8_9EUPU
MNNKTGCFKALARTVKSEKWAEFCQRVGNNKSLNLFWRLHRSMNGTVKNRCVIDFQSLDLTWQRTDENKGRALFAHYLEQSDQKDIVGRNTARQSIAAKCKNQELDVDDLVTVEEIKDAVRRAKNSAPGPDGIRYGDIGGLSDGEWEELAGIYNKSITTAIINEEWLHWYLCRSLAKTTQKFRAIG